MTARTNTSSLIVDLFVIAKDMPDGRTKERIRAAEKRLSELHLMCKHAHIIVKAQHGADHMLDGFNPRKRDIDALLSQFDEECAS